ncbi:threonylcarbamoyl-AMP synthase [Cetobacterium sp. 2A]|uniref:L-threonylcarbamoyladenylate synthase n=1 Tax=Cetobacterium sp. 2A TaxID=2754723 RepID=UPI00163CB53B|nr:threonylcarbamoyl-AMP synthase [Cetobacterium sp. 2A]
MAELIFNVENIDFKKIKEEIFQGSLIIYPTDTVYGVGGNIDSLESIKKIYSAKERNFNSPLIALVSKKENVEKIAYIEEENREKVEKLMEIFWPGGLTIILRKKDIIPEIMVSNGKTVGVRMPDYKISLQIIEAVGGIMPTTSANISGEKTPRSFDEVSKIFLDRVEIAVNCGMTPVGNESTIIDMSTNNPKILREGAISKIEIEKVIGKF